MPSFIVVSHQWLVIRFQPLFPHDHCLADCCSGLWPFVVSHVSILFLREKCSPTEWHWWSSQEEIRCHSLFQSQLYMACCVDRTQVCNCYVTRSFFHVSQGRKECTEVTYFCCHLDQSLYLYVLPPSLSSGLYLQDLTFIEMQPSYLEDKTSINFTKRWKQFKSVDHIRFAQTKWAACL